MKKHIKVYMKHFGYGEQDLIMCEMGFLAPATDIHHILFKSQGGTDEIDNLVALCRDCHDAAHGKIPGKTLSRETLFKVVEARNESRKIV